MLTCVIVTCTIPVNSVTIWSLNYFFLILYKIPFIACWLVSSSDKSLVSFELLGGGNLSNFQDWWSRVMVFNSTFNNISVILWWSVLLVEETGVPGESHRPVTSYWQTLSSNSLFSEYECSDSFTRLYLSKVKSY